MDLYFTRHGKTEWNLERRFQGMKGDSPLLASSYEEVARLGQELSDVAFETIYCSTAKRAVDTAHAIEAQLSHSVPIIQKSGLLEMGYGALEGQLIDEMRRQYGSSLEQMRYRLDLYDPSAFAGETVDEMLTRMTSTITTAVQKHDGPLLFVGHGTSMTAAIQSLIGKEIAQLREMGGLYNNSLTIAHTQDKQVPYTLVKWNDVSFLDDPTSADSLL